MRILGLASPLAALALSLSAGALWAQSFTGAGPALPFTLPAGADPAAGVRSERGPARASADAATRPEPRAAEPSTAMRHLHGTLQGFRLFGEIAASEWPIYLTEAQARAKLRFRIGYLSAVSVAPEASKLTLTVNGRSVGETAIKAPSSVKIVEFDIPDGLMKAGFNAVRLSAEQRHRVDCSPEGTYELWTQIDPAQTGLVVPEAARGAAHLGDLAALWPDADGALPIRGVLASKARPAAVERIIRAAQAVAFAGRFEQPLVDLGPPAAGGAGVNLVIGAAAEIAGIREADAIGPIGGPKVLVLAPAGQRVTVVATGTNDAEVDQAVAQLAAAARAEPKGTPEGLRAAAVFPGYRVEGGERVRLRDLGLVSQEFSGHFFRIGFNIIMPPDFLPADYAKVMLDLAGGYAPGLAKDAQVVVYINGRSVASARLPKSAGDVFKQNQIPLPLSYWRPGLNRVEIGAKVPIASDAVCDPIATLVGRKRFLFLDSTELVLPPLARIARMPNLSVTASGGLPYTAGRGRSKLFVPLPDKDTVAAAATLATRLAVSAGGPIDFRVHDRAPSRGVRADSRRRAGAHARPRHDEKRGPRSGGRARGLEGSRRSPARKAVRQRLLPRRNRRPQAAAHAARRPASLPAAALVRPRRRGMAPRSRLAARPSPRPSGGTCSTNGATPSAAAAAGSPAPGAGSRRRATGPARRRPCHGPGRPSA